MTNNKIHYRHNNFVACPCCGKPMKINFEFKRNGVVRSIRIEPIHIPICEICNKKLGGHIHHDDYDEDDPLANTRLLCESCHADLHIGRLRNSKHWTRIRAEKEVEIIFKKLYD